MPDRFMFLDIPTRAWLSCGRTFLAIAVLIVCAFTISTAQAQSQNNLMRIAAVVNDDIISVLDLEQRLRLAALSSNLNLDAQTRQRLPVQPNLPPGRARQLHHRARGRGLATAGFPNESKRFPAPHMGGEIGDSMHLAAPGERVFHRQVVYGEERGEVGHAAASWPSGRMQA